MYYVGIDAHKRYVVMATVGNTGEVELPSTRVEAGDREGLLERLRPFRPLRAVAEASPFWPWIADALVSEGIEFVLAHAKKLRAIAEADQKDDATDAELLARMLQAGLIPQVYPKPREQRELARLVRHRAVLGRQRTALANRVHSQLHARGLVLERGRLLTESGQGWLHSVAWAELGAEQRRLVRTHLEVIETLDPLIAELDARIEEVGETQPAVALLRSVPGIGPYRALLLAVEILPLWRFPSPAHLVSYAGLAPRTRSSGGKTKHGSIPVNANRWIRGVLVQSVVSHLSAAPESALSAYYARQKERLGWPTARVAAARKLCRILYRMLQTGEHWRSEEESEGDVRDELRNVHAASTA